MKLIFHLQPIILPEDFCNTFTVITSHYDIICDEKKTHIWNKNKTYRDESVSQPVRHSLHWK